MKLFLECRKILQEFQIHQNNFHKFVHKFFFQKIFILSSYCFLPSIFIISWNLSFIQFLHSMSFSCSFFISSWYVQFFRKWQYMLGVWKWEWSRFIFSMHGSFFVFKIFFYKFNVIFKEFFFRENDFLIKRFCFKTSALKKPQLPNLF